MSAPYTVPDDRFPWLPRARSRYLARAARLVLDPGPLPHWLATAWGGIREPLATALKDHRGEFLAALALPTVGAPLFAGRLDVALPQLLWELGRMRVLGREGVFWPGQVTRILSPVHGTALDLGRGVSGMLFTDGRLELDDGTTWDGAGERVFFPLAQGGWLATVDDNPLSGLEAHPDKHGSAVDLGGRSVQEWVATVDAARGLVRDLVPELAREHATVLAEVVPVGWEPEKSLSASYREAVGVAYLTLHPKIVVIAEALIHETQHNKLNMLLWSDELIHDDGALHVSPVRPDPRPLLGVLLAAHAFLAVAELYLALAERGHPDADPQRLATVMRQNAEALEVVRDARTTEAGRSLIEGMVRLEGEQRARAELGGASA